MKVNHDLLGFCIQKTVLNTILRVGWFCVLWVSVNINCFICKCNDVSRKNSWFMHLFFFQITGNKIYVEHLLDGNFRGINTITGFLFVICNFFIKEKKCIKKCNARTSSINEMKSLNNLEISRGLFINCIINYYTI